MFSKHLFLRTPLKDCFCKFSGISSEGVDSFSRLLPKAALFVLPNAASLVASDVTKRLSCQGFYCEITVIIPKKFLYAFNMISLSFGIIFVDFNLLKASNLIFGKL